MDIDALQARFGRPGRVAVRGSNDGAPLIEVTHPQARARISLKGAQVLSFIPAGGSELLWVSPVARMAGPDAMRGGIPVCWPWFAAHPTDPAKPMHGFVRTAVWALIETGDAADGQAARIVLRTSTTEAHQALWPHQATVQLTVEVGARLTLALETINTGATPFDLTGALHTYFKVSDVTQAQVLGLDGIDYLDKVEGFARKRQMGPVVFNSEVDRIYVGTSSATAIEDAGLSRRIAIAKGGSTSTVVWNPARERGARMPDVGPEAWRDFVCVETSNAGDDVVHVVPGASHTLSAVYEVTPFDRV